jgi:hypothetical protein
MQGISCALRDKCLFYTVRPVLGSISWQGGQDLCPDTLYLDGRDPEREPGL